MQDSSSRVVRHLWLALLALVLVMVVGTLGYRVLGAGQYSWLDCFYMTFITISTIGYIEAVDVSHYEYGRLFTVVIGFAGIGVLGYVLSTVTAFMLEGDLNVTWRRKKMRERIEKLGEHYIVCGLGRVGANVAHELASTGRSCVIVDTDLARLDQYRDNHPGQLYLQGDATDNDVLLAAGIMRARGVFAVASDDGQNLVISLSAKQLNPALRVVARCHDTKNVDKTRRAGADEIVLPDLTGGLSLVSAMVRPHVQSFFDEMHKTGNRLRMEELVVTSAFSGRPLASLCPVSPEYIVLAIRQNGQWTFNPPDQHTMRDGDVLMVMATPQGRAALEGMVPAASS